MNVGLNRGITQHACGHLEQQDKQLKETPRLSMLKAPSLEHSSVADIAELQCHAP